MIDLLTEIIVCITEYISDYLLDSFFIGLLVKIFITIFLKQIIEYILEYLSNRDNLLVVIKIIKKIALKVLGLLSKLCRILIFITTKTFYFVNYTPLSGLMPLEAGACSLPTRGTTLC